LKCNFHGIFGLGVMEEKELRDDELGEKGIYTIMQEQSEK
jgi:hypothetical protein